MKRFCVIFFISLSVPAFAYESRPVRAPYVIVSDNFDAKVAEGTCIVFGTVVSDLGGLQGSTIATTNRSAEAFTDLNGKYSITLSAKDSSIFFYDPGYGEIVIWKYDFKSQHRVEINFFPPSKHEQNQNLKKPVIYLYADQETNVELTLMHPNVTFTYPAYKENWSVKTLANGSVQDLATKKMYPYLFWEGETTNLRYLSYDEKISGQLVKTDTLVKFLESALTKMGLNQNEQTDFITFWAPTIVSKDFVFIQFLIDEDYDNLVAGLDVSPTPDCRRRIFMQFTLLENDFVPFEFASQDFPEFKRKGLTLVEWGGSEIDFRLVVN